MVDVFNGLMSINKRMISIFLSWLQYGGVLVGFNLLNKKSRIFEERFSILTCSFIYQSALHQLLSIKDSKML